MKDDQKDQNSSQVGKEHRAFPSAESQATPKSDATPSGRDTPMGKFKNSVGFQFMFVLHSGLDIPTAVKHVCNAAERLIAAQWQPIETAPLNESVLVYIPNAEHYGEGIYRAIWIQSDWTTGPDGKHPRHWQTTGYHVGRDVGAGYSQPTHWMPLPDVPNTQDTNTLASGGKSSPSR